MRIILKLLAWKGRTGWRPSRQVSGSNYSKLVEVVDSQITETDNYDLDLLLTSTGATLTTRDGIGNLSIDGNFLGQNVGVGAVMALSQFDNFMVIGIA